MKKIRSCVIFLSFFALAAQCVVAEESVKILSNFAMALPPVGRTTLLCADLKSLVDRMDSLQVWKEYKKLPHAARFVEFLDAEMAGFDTMGYDRKDLLGLLRNEFGAIISNSPANGGPPSAVFVISSKGKREMLDDIIQRLRAFAVIQNSGLSQWSAGDIQAFSVSSNLHFADTRRFFVFGNNRNLMRQTLLGLKSAPASGGLFSMPEYSALSASAHTSSEFWASIASSEIPGRLKSLGTEDIFISGKMKDRMDLKCTFAMASNSKFADDLRQLRLEYGLFQCLPSAFYYAEALNTSVQSGPDMLDAMGLMPETKAARNRIFYRDFVNSLRPVLGTNGMLVCKPYQSSTNYAFVFRLKPGSKVKDIVRSVWPSMNAVSADFQGHAIYFYPEKGGADEVNYLGFAGGFVIAGDALKIVQACLEAFDGKYGALSNPSFISAWNGMPDPKRTFLVFNTLKWANAAFEDSWEFLKTAGKFSSFILCASQELKTPEPLGVSIFIRNFPLVSVGNEGK